jgi:hypothetical protein
MQVIIDRLNGIIRSALRAYLAAERDLDAANEAGDPAGVRETKEKVDLARQAVDLLHHFADFVCKESDPALPTFKTPSDVRNAIRPLCAFTRTTPVDDVSLLMDVADAFKHQQLASRIPHRVFPRCPGAVLCALLPIFVEVGLCAIDEKDQPGFLEIGARLVEGGGRAGSPVAGGSNPG